MRKNNYTNLIKSYPIQPKACWPLPEDFIIRITYHSSRDLADSITHPGRIFMCEDNKVILAKEY
jgi:hypothetical protein